MISRYKNIQYIYNMLLLKDSVFVEVVKSHSPPPEGLRPACCLPRHPEPKGLHKQRRWRMRESNLPLCLEGELAN